MYKKITAMNKAQIQINSLKKGTKNTGNSYHTIKSQMKFKQMDEKIMHLL